MKIPAATEWSVGQVAQDAGVTVRTLHHYDSIGLLTPSARSQAGYRVYNGADLQRLRRILVYRDLGFPLEQIAALMEGEETDVLEHLRSRRSAVAAEVQQLQAVIAALDAAIESQGTERAMTDLTPEQRDSYLRLQERYGSTKEWQASAAQTAASTDAQQAEGMAARRAWVAAFQSAIDEGADPDSERGMAIAEESRQSASRWGGYDGTYQIHIAMTENWAAEPDGMFSLMVRPDEQRPGMAEFLRDAAVANAQRAQADS
jgi:DNA-binding transcriptional MerR regulator